MNRCTTCSLVATVHHSASLNSILKIISLIYALLTWKWHQLGQGSHKSSNYIRASSSIFFFLANCSVQLWAEPALPEWLWSDEWIGFDISRPVLGKLTKHRSRWWRRRPSETLVTSSGRGEDLCLLFGSNRSRICLWSCQSLNKEYSRSNVK